MKKIIILVLALLMFSCGCTSQKNDVKFDSQQPIEISTDTAVKSIWITYYELSKYTVGKTENQFKREISNLFKELKQKGFNTVTIQVRPCADSFYPSKYFPTSIYFNKVQGSKMDYDPLMIICELAENNSLHIEAWINPYRVSQKNSLKDLSEKNIAKKWLEQGSNKVIKANGKLYFNPAYSEISDLIVNGVAEIVEKYSVSAIHFDDYFYPTTDKKIDEKEFSAYRKKGGTLSLGDWRRENVSNMVKSVYCKIKEINPNVRFGISPASNMENDKNNLYADVEKWITEEGYIDYICPQVYFGFKNVYQPFMQTTKKWVKLCENKKDLYIGLALYKAGEIDKYAAQNDISIKNEFVDNSNIISRQIKYISKIDEIKGYYIFSLSSLKNEKAKIEVSHMLNAMQSNSPS